MKRATLVMALPLAALWTGCGGEFSPKNPLAIPPTPTPAPPMPANYFEDFEAGVSGNIEVVQAQDSVSAAAFEYINSVFSHNLAKLNLARSLGNTEARIREYLRR